MKKKETPYKFPKDWGKMKQEKKEPFTMLSITLSTETFDPMYFNPKDFFKKFKKAEGYRFAGVRVNDIVGKLGRRLDFIFLK